MFRTAVLTLVGRKGYSRVDSGRQGHTSGGAGNVVPSSSRSLAFGTALSDMLSLSSSGFRQSALAGYF